MLYFLGAGVLLTKQVFEYREKKVFRNQSNIYDGAFCKIS